MMTVNAHWNCGFLTTLIQKFQLVFRFPYLLSFSFLFFWTYSSCRRFVVRRRASSCVVVRRASSCVVRSRVFCAHSFWWRVFLDKNYLSKVVCALEFYFEDEIFNSFVWCAILFFVLLSRISREVDVFLWVVCARQKNQKYFCSIPWFFDEKNKIFHERGHSSFIVYVPRHQKAAEWHSRSQLAGGA